MEKLFKKNNYRTTELWRDSILYHFNTISYNDVGWEVVEKVIGFEPLSIVLVLTTKHVYITPDKTLLKNENKKGSRTDNLESIQKAI